MIHEKFIYLHQVASANLNIFHIRLGSILSGTSDESWRTPDNQARYKNMLSELGDVTIYDKIKKRMGGRKLALMENDFPYDALMPQDSQLKHLCLWATDENLLTPKLINTILDRGFPSMPALVFMHNGELNTVKNIPHAHLIIDMEKY